MKIIKLIAICTAVLATCIPLSGCKNKTMNGNENPQTQTVRSVNDEATENENPDDECPDGKCPNDECPDGECPDDDECPDGKCPPRGRRRPHERHKGPHGRHSKTLPCPAN